MSMGIADEDRVDEVLHQNPHVTIFLRPVAPPAAMGLAGFASSTFITASWIAGWYGNSESPLIFFPFVAAFGGLAQFIAGLQGFVARDVLVTVINTLWGTFWMAIGLLYFLVSNGNIDGHSIYTHFPELAVWFVPIAAITWSCALAATARDIVLAATLTTLAIGSTIACCLFAYGAGTQAGIKAAAYFWLLSALLAWWRVTAYVIEEAYGPGHPVTKCFPIGHTPHEKAQPLIIPGLGEPGVKRGVPKYLPAVKRGGSGKQE